MGFVPFSKPILTVFTTGVRERPIEPSGDSVLTDYLILAGSTFDGEFNIVD